MTDEDAADPAEDVARSAEDEPTRASAKPDATGPGTATGEATADDTVWPADGAAGRGNGPGPTDGTPHEGAPHDPGPEAELPLEAEGPHEEDREGNVAGMLAQDQPLEPGTIDLENALFVLLGVVIVVGFLVLGIAGL